MQSCYRLFAKCLGTTARSPSPHPSQAHLARNGARHPLLALSSWPISVTLSSAGHWSPGSGALWLFRADTAAGLPVESTGPLGSGTLPPSMRQPGSRANRPCSLLAGGDLGHPNSVPRAPSSSSANEDRTHGLRKHSAHWPAHDRAPIVSDLQEEWNGCQKHHGQPYRHGDRRRSPDLRHV